MLMFEMRNYDKNIKELTGLHDKYGELYIMGTASSGKRTLKAILEKRGMNVKEVTSLETVAMLEEIPDDVCFGQIVFLVGHHSETHIKFRR